MIFLFFHPGSEIILQVISLWCEFLSRTPLNLHVHRNSLAIDIHHELLSPLQDRNIFMGYPFCTLLTRHFLRIGNFETGLLLV